jgi:predicted Zn-dependent peptidase
MRKLHQTGRPVALALATALAVGGATAAGRAIAAEGDAARAAKPVGAPAADPKIPFEKYTLDNGLEVILLQDNRTPVVFVSVWYHVGSGDETPGKSGFAHLFEHMMFQGTKNTGEDQHFKVLQTIGASSVNGTTNSDRTNYFEQVPSNQLETALWLESERMGYLLGSVTPESLKNQIDVVRNERRQRLDNQPYAVELFASLALLYPEGHPYRYSVIGRHEDLESASLDDVKNFFKKWYVPANATLTIAGDFEPAAAKAAVQKWFGGFPKAQKPMRKAAPAPRLAKTARQVVEDPLAKLRRVHYVWHSPASYAPGDAELDLLAWSLGSQTGRLYRALVIDRTLARSVMVAQGGQQWSGTFDIIVDLLPDADLAEVEKIINAEVARVLAEPISDKELARALTNVEAAFITGLEPLIARAETLQSYNHYFGDPGAITADLARYRAATPAGILEAAKRVLSAPRVELVTMPKGGK